MNPSDPVIKRLKSKVDTLCQRRHDLEQETEKHCLIVSLLVAQGFDMSLSTNTRAFYDRPFPLPERFPALFS